MLFMIAGWGLIGACSGISDSQYRHGRYQIALMLASTGVLLTLWFLSDRLGIDALALGWAFGIGLGAVIAFLFLWTQDRKRMIWSGWRTQLRVLRNLLDRTWGMSFWFLLNQIPFWIERYYAAKLQPGSLSALGYAQRLVQFPLEMVTSIVMSVWISRIVEVPQHNIARRTFLFMGRLSVVSFPTAFLLMLFARPLVAFVFSRGAFGQQAVIMTAAPFAMYALGLGFHILSAILVRTFQARGAFRFPMFAVLIDIALIGVLNIYASHRGWEASGIAAINSLVAGIRVVFLGIGMRFAKI
jgi:putative peptidoglycan lipid II flippase